MRGEHGHAVASLWLVPACSSAMLLGTDSFEPPVFIVSSATIVQSNMEHVTSNSKGAEVSWTHRVSIASTLRFLQFFQDSCFVFSPLNLLFYCLRTWCSMLKIKAVLWTPEYHKAKKGLSFKYIIPTDSSSLVSAQISFSSFGIGYNIYV